MHKILKVFIRSLKGLKKGQINVNTHTERHKSFNGTINPFHFILTKKGKIQKPSPNTAWWRVYPFIYQVKPFCLISFSPATPFQATARFCPSVPCSIPQHPLLLLCLPPFRPLMWQPNQFAQSLRQLLLRILFFSFTLQRMQEVWL